MTSDEELIEKITALIMSNDYGAGDDSWESNKAKAKDILAAVRAHDREERAKIDESLVPKGDPDDYRDLHLVTRMEHGPGLREA